MTEEPREEESSAEEHGADSGSVEEEARRFDADSAGADGPEPGAEKEEGSGGEEVELPPEIREQLEELEELRDKHLRLAAEFDNYRKRTRREISAQQERAQAQLARRLLDALDDLRRFNEAAREGDAGVETLREGMELVEKKLRKELGDAGLAKIDAEGEKFDPNVHEALTVKPVEDGDRDGYVSQVLVDGYTFGDQLLRPARVEVMKRRESGGGNGGESTDENEG